MGIERSVSAAKARPVALSPRHRAGSGRRARSHRGKAPSISRRTRKRPAVLDGVPRPLPWARCAETLVGGGPAGGHRTHKAIRDEDYAGANRLMWPVEKSRERPRREAGLRYSAGRARRGCGRFLPLISPVRHRTSLASPRTLPSALSPLGDWARGKPSTHIFSPPDSLGATALRKTNTPTNKHLKSRPEFGCKGNSTA